MGSQTTIIYYTDGHVEDKIGNLARKYIAKADNPIISVTQQPLDFGENICVGDIGRSFKNIQTQILVGAFKTKTKYIALAEHDMLYPEGYFDWLPPRDDTFYYNNNKVYAVAKKGPQYGMYILANDRHPNASDLICEKNIFISATLRRLEMLKKGLPYPIGWCEPGFNWEGEKMEWRHEKIPTIEIFHDDNFTARHGNFTETCWSVDGWGRFEDIE